MGEMVIVILHVAAMLLPLAGLHHLPVITYRAKRLVIACCCCGWVPTPGNTLAGHLRREALLAKITRLHDDGLVGHFDPRLPVHMLDRYHDHNEILTALRMGEWPKVVAMLKEAEKHDGHAHRDS